MRKNGDGTMTVPGHFAELRQRLIWAGGAFLGTAVFAFSRADHIRGIITAPVDGMGFVYLSPPEAFAVTLRIALIAGAVLAFPVILYQGIAFLLPALYRQEKKLFLGAITGACILFVTGSLFAYYVFIPFIWGFFLKFSSKQLPPYINISDYVTFICSFTVTFGLVFQVPLLSWILARMGLITARVLQCYWKHALLIILVISAIITPPDIISQVLMAVPLMLLYELAVFTVFLGQRSEAGKMLKGLG